MPTSLFRNELGTWLIHFESFSFDSIFLYYRNQEKRYRFAWCSNKIYLKNK